jgi:toxin ParE1/3/4
MTKAIRIDAEAEEEIAHAIDRYERDRVGLGAEFWDELRAAIRTLEAPGPECGPVIGLPRELGVRRKLLVRFPYAIVFVESDAFVRVISVMHGHRRPAYWRRRIG